MNEVGVTVRLFTTLAAVESAEGRVSNIIVNDKQGLKALAAKVFVDATGDGDLAAWAGAAFEKGDSDGTLQPATHCFSLGNVDEYHYRHGPSLYGGDPKSPIFDIVRSGKFDLIPDTHSCNNIVGPRTIGFNAGHLWNVDSTEPDTISRAMMQGRRQAEQFRQALAEYHPKAFAAAFVNATGSLPVQNSNSIKYLFKLQISIIKS